jgi:hypothetical protein
VKNVQISRKKFIFALTLCALIGTINGYMIQNYTPHHSPHPTANVFLTVQNEFGVYDIPTSNVITDIGENYTGNWMGYCGTLNTTARNATQWISLSNDASPSQTWTKLPNEATTFGAGRALGTLSDPWMSSGDYAYNVTNKFTFTGAITLQCAGLQWSGEASSDNNLFACASFTQTAFDNNWNLTITWAIVWNAN